MKNAISFVIFAISAVISLGAQAKDVTANIINVSPVYSNLIQNQQVCETIQVVQPQQASSVNAGSVIGGIAGALLGGQVGGGNGRVAMSALGAVTGAITGDRLSQRDSQAIQSQQVCHWVQRVDPQISGYRVNYEYAGDTFESVMPYDPSRGGTVKSVTVQMSLTMR